MCVAVSQLAGNSYVVLLRRKLQVAPSPADIDGGDLPDPSLFIQ